VVTTEIFREHIDFGNLIKTVSSRGWAFEPEALTRDFAAELAAVANAAPFEAFWAEEKGVRQEFEVRKPEFPGADDAITELGLKTGQLVRWHCGLQRTLRGWQPNEVSVQRYSSPTAGIDRHRDYQRDVLLVASFTAAGYGQVAMYAERHDNEPQLMLETGPGSLLLLRGPGLTGSGEDRPTHAVLPPISKSRLSVTYRQSRPMPLPAIAGGGIYLVFNRLTSISAIW
jgi:hypothetical protein